MIYLDDLSGFTYRTRLQDSLTGVTFRIHDNVLSILIVHSKDALQEIIVSTHIQQYQSGHTVIKYCQDFFS